MHQKSFRQSNFHASKINTDVDSTISTAGWLDLNRLKAEGKTNGGRQPADVNTTISPARVSEPDHLKLEGEKESIEICDPQFLEELRSLRDLHSFFIKEAVSVVSSEAALHALGHLNSLYYKSNGRRATPEEWASVQRLTQELFGLLTDSLRRKYTLGRAPSWISELSLFFAGTALFSLIFSVFFGTLTHDIFFKGHQDVQLEFVTQNILLFYALWLFSLGSLGAIAFIGMNALAIQQDITFDLANSRLMILRIVLGGLFGFVLTLPFGFEGYVKFCTHIALGTFPLFSGESQVPVNIPRQSRGL